MRWIPLASLALLLVTGCGGNDSNNAAPPKKKGIIGQKTTDVVDAQKALEDPDVERASTKIEGSDPISTSTSYQPETHQNTCPSG